MKLKCVSNIFSVVYATSAFKYHIFSLARLHNPQNTLHNDQKKIPNQLYSFFCFILESIKEDFVSQTEMLILKQNSYKQMQAKFSKTQQAPEVSPEPQEEVMCHELTGTAGPCSPP